MTNTFEARAHPGGWLPMAAYVSVLAVLLLVSWQVTTQFVEDPQGLPDATFGDDFLDGWARYDGGWYLGIAAQGYDYTPGQQSSVAFFPGYPLSVRAAGDVLGDPLVGGVLVTIASGLGAVVLFWRWCCDRMAIGAAVTALALLTLYPYGYYLYGAIYGDAMFLLCALGAFVLLERDHPVLAGLAGLVATATRSVGIAVAVGLVVRAVERRGGFSETTSWGFPRRVELRRLKARDGGVLLSLVGLLAFAAFLWREFGDPFLFSSVQKHWDQPATPSTWFKWAVVQQVFGGDDRLYVYGILVQAALTLGAVLSIPFVGRRFGWGYAAYLTVLLLLPAVGSKDFQGMGRYLLGAFPVFGLLGEGLAQHPLARRIVLPCSALLLVLLTAGFAHGLYLA